MHSGRGRATLAGGLITILPRPVNVGGSDLRYLLKDVLDVMRSLGVEDDALEAVKSTPGIGAFVTLEQLRMALRSAGINRRLELRIEDSLVSSVGIWQAMNSLGRVWWVSVRYVTNPRFAGTAFIPEV